MKIISDINHEHSVAKKVRNSPDPMAPVSSLRLDFYVSR